MSDCPIPSSQETMPQTSVVFSSILGPSCSGQGQPGMGERGGGAGGSGDLIFQDGRLISGSLEALMEHLVPTVDYYPDVSPGDRQGQPGREAGLGREAGSERTEQWGRCRVAGSPALPSRALPPLPSLPLLPQASRRWPWGRRGG